MLCEVRFKLTTSFAAQVHRRECVPSLYRVPLTFNVDVDGAVKPFLLSKSYKTTHNEQKCFKHCNVISTDGRIYRRGMGRGGSGWGCGLGYTATSHYEVGNM